MASKLSDSLKVIDRFNVLLGSLSKWVVAALVFVVFYEVVARYIFGSPTVWGYQMMCMLGATIAALGWGYVESQNGHVRVDVIYVMFPKKVQLFIDLVGGIIFGIPLFVVYIYLSLTWAINAVKSKEILMETFWYPSAVPIRIIILLGFIFGFVQFLANYIRLIVTLVKGEEK